MIGAAGDVAWPLLRGLLFRTDPETAHGLSLTGLKTGMVRAVGLAADPRLSVDVAGLHFPNPLGLAAGYDKNAEVMAPILGLGFGFTEVGTITPRPQPGNPKPRIFRLVEDRAVINRFGFNSEGHEAALVRLQGAGSPGIIGVNIGANKETSDRVGDYVAGIRAFRKVASYFTVNISSPNTPGLRDLQARDSLRELLVAVLAARDELGPRVPVLLKIAPDLTEEGLDDIAVEVPGSGLDGLIVSNTTLSRAGLNDKQYAGEAGGMSGQPLFARSTAVLARMRRRLGPDFPIIGVGGVHSAETAAEKIRAGADMVQLYSSLVYEGPGLPARIVRGLSALCDRDRLQSIREIRDSRLDHWLAEKI